MGKMLDWLIVNERRMLIWVNRRPVGGKLYTFIDKWLSIITHMGGATFTLATALLFALLATAPWSVTGWQCLTAVTISHIPVAIVKRKFKRLRPYQALTGVNTCPEPLRDSSFPSGHTTAIFAWVVPILLTSGIWLSVLIPAAMLIALSVAWSRMYLGLHYPSDVAVGALLGTVTAFAVNFFWVVQVSV